MQTLKTVNFYFLNHLSKLMSATIKKECFTVEVCERIIFRVEKIHLFLGPIIATFSFE